MDNVSVQVSNGKSRSENKHRSHSGRATVGAEGGLRNQSEREATAAYARLFAESPDPLELKLAHFAKYVRRQDMTRLLARYEIFKRILPVKGSIVECGVYRGGGLMSWGNFSAILEPNNLTRRVYGFDSFAGFPQVSAQDATAARITRPGELAADCFGELQELIGAFDQNRFLGHVPKVELIRGDATETIPAFLKSHPHVVISLLFLDFDLYEPTKVALEHLLPRMPKGAVIAFDELDNPAWPGETLALLHQSGICPLRLERLEFDPYIGFALID
ncbi:MAG TPA: TylF/MycF/NovP-related O-methyltransferase [Pirellulales bacterium]|nr:TylF/MycF/NovP-related O-methyltransferase [Pirellulales bacterium]